MAGGIIIVRHPTKTSIRYMLVTSLVGILLGLVMLFYPGGTMTLMKTGFKIFQGILTIFVLYYTISEAIHYLKGGQMVRGIGYILLGVLFTALIWLIDVKWIFYVVAFFLTVIGIGEIVGAFQIPVGKFFLGLLGIVDLMVALIIVLNPLVLAILIAWYVLFWGVSRLFLSLELRKALE